MQPTKIEKTNKNFKKNRKFWKTYYASRYSPLIRLLLYV